MTMRIDKIRKADNYKDYSKLIMSQMKRDVMTNSFMSGSEIKAEISCGNLFYALLDGGLLIFRRRDGHVRLNYYIRDIEKMKDASDVISDAASKMSELCGCDPDGECPVVCEVVKKPDAVQGTQSVMCEMDDMLGSAGFLKALRRMRMHRGKIDMMSTVLCDNDERLHAVSDGYDDSSRAPDKCEGEPEAMIFDPDKKALLKVVGCEESARVQIDGHDESAVAEADGFDVTVRIACSKDLEKVKKLLYDNFDSMTGCLPTDNELASDIDAGNYIYAEKCGMPAGIIHFEKNKKSSEIRHLAVSRTMRECGIASRMFAFYISKTQKEKNLVWVRKENDNAIEFYRYCGYEPDGWTSEVYVR